MIIIIQNTTYKSAIYDEVINIKHLPSGLYYISIIGGAEISIAKFMVVR